MSNTLFVLGNILSTSAQGERYLQLARRLSIDAQITFLSYSQPFGAEIDRVRTKTVSKMHNKYLLKIKQKLRSKFFPDQHIFHISAYKKTILTEIALTKPEVIVIGMTPFSLLILGKYIKRIAPGALLIGDLSDPFSFNMGLRVHHIKRKIAIWIEKKYFQNFDYLVILNDRIKQRYQELYPACADKFKVVEQGIDEEFVNKVNAQTQPCNEVLTFLYAGCFYKRGRNPDVVYDAFEQNNNNLKLDIYGNIRKALRPKSCNKVLYHPAVPKNELVKITAQADVLLLYDNNFGLQVPGKTLETLAINKPVLFVYHNEDSPTLDYVRAAGGVVWAQDDIISIRAGIDQIIRGNYEPRTFNYSPYTWDTLILSYMNLMKLREG